MSLDDFWAKKGKKKIKGQKFTSTEGMAKRLEDLEKKEEKAASTALSKKNIDTIIEKNGDVHEDHTNAEIIPEVTENPEQWKDFEDKAEVDVSDLKITNLNTEDDENAGSDDNGDNDSTNGDNKKESVWKVEPKEMPSICDAVDSAMEDGRDVKATVAAVTASAAKWVPNKGNDMVASPLPRGPGGGSGGGNRRKKTAPDLKNEDAFPTLGNKPKKKQQTKKTEETASPRSAPARAPQGNSAGGYYVPPSSRVKTGNRYGGLTDQSSKF